MKQGGKEDERKSRKKTETNKSTKERKKAGNHASPSEQSIY
jgi:hypothetical protein